MKKLGLIGYPLGHSFSKKYYLDKFESEQIKGIDYDLYSLPDIANFLSCTCRINSFTALM